MGLKVHINNSHYSFDGPHLSTDNLLKRSGVYVISTVRDGFHKILDVGESGDVHDRISNHDRKHQWQQHAADALYVSALYCNNVERMTIESQVRQFHNPPCGIR